MEHIKERIKTLSTEIFEEIVEIRRIIHRNPETGFEEFKTAKLICEILDKNNIGYTEGIAGTGVLAVVKGRSPESKCIALRADMDALCINENSEKDYKSQVQGLMHACGHDAHTASLLGTAIIINKLKENFNGTVKFIFQPSEEKLPGGAALMIKEGVLLGDEPHSVIAQHVSPEIETGKIGVRSGFFMASADEVYISVKGKGGHAAKPDTLVDPVLIASHIVVALQQIASRMAPPAIPTVLSFGRVIADGQNNIIPDKVDIAGTFRTFDMEWRAKAHEKITNIATKLAESMGAKCEVNIIKGYPALYNEPALTSRLRNYAADYLGEENIIELDKRMTAEDFAYFALEKPSCLYRLGTGNKQKGITAGLHTPEFDIDEKSLETGIGLMAWCAINELAK